MSHYSESDCCEIRATTSVRPVVLISQPSLLSRVVAVSHELTRITAEPSGGSDVRTVTLCKGDGRHIDATTFDVCDGREVRNVTLKVALSRGNCNFEQSDGSTAKPTTLGQMSSLSAS